MIAATALELLVLGLAIWQLIVVRRSLRADREKAAQDGAEASSDTLRETLRQDGGHAD